MNPRNIVVTGFMGAGKSSVGLRMADELGREFYDMDRILVERHGPIDVIFKKWGEHHFRKLERELLGELLAMKGVIISSGGGTLVDRSNCDDARENSIVVWLEVGYDVAVARIKNDVEGMKRPNADARMFERFNFRQPLYKRAAYITIDANRPIEDVVASVMEELEPA